MILRLQEDTATAGSYDPYTCKVRDSFFYECLDIASPQTLSSSINGSFGVSASSTAFTWLSDGLNISSTNFFGGPALCNDKITGDGAVNSLDVALLMWYQFEQPPYDRTNLPRTPAEISTVAGRHDTWKRCETNEARTSWQLTVGQDYCATSDNFAPPPPTSSASLAECQDLMSVADNTVPWQSSTGHTCEDYTNENWCTGAPDYTYGPGWRPWYGPFADWEVNGRHAGQACCACGGGFQQVTPCASSSLLAC